MRRLWMLLLPVGDGSIVTTGNAPCLKANLTCVGNGARLFWPMGILIACTPVNAAAFAV